MRKRPLVVSAILFFLGILISFYKLWWLTVLVPILGAIFFTKKNKARLFLVALIIILLGMARMQLAISRADYVLSHNKGSRGEMSLVITQPTTNGRTMAFIETDKGKMDVYLRVEEQTNLDCGDIVTGKIILCMPFDNKVDEESFMNQLMSRGAYIQAIADRVEITGQYTKGILGKFYTMRAKVQTRAKELFQGDRLALFSAMVLGNKSLLSDELYAKLQGSGLNHIAVVSGIHLSVVIAFVIFIARRLFGKRRIGFLIAMSGAIFITLFTGAGASVVRALIMCFIYYVARLIYREKDGLTSLFCAVLIMLIINPYIIFNVGFVLSVLSVLGIILYSKKLSDFFARFMPKAVASAISLTLSAQLILTPIIVYYFGVITPYAPLSNIIAVPLSSIFVVVGIFLVILSPIKIIAMILTAIMNFLADAICSLCENVSSMPYALIEWEGSFLAFLVVWGFLAFMVYCFPIPTAKIKKSVTVFAILAITVSLVTQIKFDKFNFISYGRHILATVKTQEGALWIDCPNYYEAVVSGHTGENIVLSKKLTQSVFHLKRVKRRIYMPGDVLKEEKKETLIKKAQECDATIYFIKDKEKFMVEGATLRYIAVGDATDTRAVEMNIGGKRIISLQGFSQKEIAKMITDREVFVCDYLYSPYKIEGIEALSTGEIISNNKFLLKR